MYSELLPSIFYFVFGVKTYLSYKYGVQTPLMQCKPLLMAVLFFLCTLWVLGSALVSTAFSILLQVYFCH